ncbi:FMN phosphatase YigB (HAD superfamily) [Catenuloplanes nepalensis]|uniref:FMN phosphatase YigB (HAD superfamily) n=1 Tax=Catenuloplanes nepalensis TaxID=587533 RepID=A0ABT9MM73_9ACTN|nr:HAD family hydrolase [Catenuloplanes nepalensis]MDP9792525.1 FMN phosphatase YigB (HAD superfamily) [Catenuloplanes nepalensis]
MITAVVFDIGETLLDDTREWAAWADWLGVPRHTFSAVVGAVVASGRDNRESFAYFRDDFDLERERAARIAAGAGQVIEESDLYADVRPALSVLRRARVWVGIAGNQTAAVGDRLRTLDLPADAIATSADWGVGKPDPGFFDRVASMSPAGRSGLLYVGDHRDHDLVAGHRAGVRTALVRRGPWGHLWHDDPAVRATAAFVVDGLADLADAVLATRANAQAHPDVSYSPASTGTE